MKGKRAHQFLENVSIYKGANDRVAPLMELIFQFKYLRSIYVACLINIRPVKLAVTYIWFPILYICLEFFYIFVFLNFRGDHTPDFSKKIAK